MTHFFHKAILRSPIEIVLRDWCLSHEVKLHGNVGLEAFLEVSPWESDWETTRLYAYLIM